MIIQFDDDDDDDDDDDYDGDDDDYCDGTVQDTIRVKTIFIIQAELPIRKQDTFITSVKWGVYSHSG